MATTIKHDRFADQVKAFEDIEIGEWFKSIEDTAEDRIQLKISDFDALLYEENNVVVRTIPDDYVAYLIDVTYSSEECLHSHSISDMPVGEVFFLHDDPEEWGMIKIDNNRCFDTETNRIIGCKPEDAGFVYNTTIEWSITEV